MKVYVNELGHVVELYASQNPQLREVDTYLLEPQEIWPDVRLLKYAVGFDEDGIPCSVYPYKSVDPEELEVKRAAQQQALLAQLNVPADAEMEGHAAATRQAMDRAGDLIPDKDAPDYLALYAHWEVGVDYAVGNKRQDEGVLYKCLQAHTSQADWKPKDTPALWHRLDEAHKGTREDPIPAALGLEYQKDLYYLEDAVVYKCIRNSEQPLYNMPSELVGIYFELV